MWHWMVGIALGLIVAVTTTTLAIQYSNSNTGQYTNRNTDRRRIRKNVEYIQNPDDPCAICFDRMSQSSIKYLPCLHGLHHKCYNDLMETAQPVCPICRHKIE